MQKFRSSLARFLSKYIVLYSGISVLFLFAGAVFSWIVFPDAGFAAFVMISAASITQALADFAANLISAEQERTEKERDRKQNEMIDKLDDE